MDALTGSGGAGAADGAAGRGGSGGGGGGFVTDAGPDLPASGGSAGSGGSGSTDAGPGLSCPVTIAGSLDVTDRTQTGRVSRIPPSSICPSSKPFPGNVADPSNPHLYDVYQFVNPTGAPACFTFTLAYAAGIQRYLTAYANYDPTDIGSRYLGDVGDQLVSPQTMSITVPARSAIDVVVFAIDVAPNGTGSYTLSCAN